MISSHRLKSAYTEGQISAIQTKGIPYLTQNPYHKWSSQGKMFSKGYSETANRFRKIWGTVKTSH